MLGIRKIPWPQFSLAGLLWFASAVAIGFAVGRREVTADSCLWLPTFQQVFYTPTLLAIASGLVIYELIRHVLVLRRLPERNQLRDSSLLFAWVVRFVLAIGILIVLLLTQLINRHILEQFLKCCSQGATD